MMFNSNKSKDNDLFQNFVKHIKSQDDLKIEGSVEKFIVKMKNGE